MLNEHVVEKRYFSMTEASAMLQLSMPEIREWDDRFNLHVHRNGRKERAPSMNDIERLTALKALKRYFRNEGIDMITRDFERIKEVGLDGIFLPKIMRLCQKK